ncbi:hypothetical protein AKJ16_DCAP14278 [Drosera capensis]
MCSRYVTSVPKMFVPHVLPMDWVWQLELSILMLDRPKKPTGSDEGTRYMLLASNMTVGYGIQANRSDPLGMPPHTSIAPQCNAGFDHLCRIHLNGVDSELVLVPDV